jgi:hypothetical protein
MSKIYGMSSLASGSFVGLNRLGFNRVKIEDFFYKKLSVLLKKQHYVLPPLFESRI